MKITKKKIKNCLKLLKTDLLVNPNDYSMIDLYENKTPRAIITECGKIKFINPSYNKSISLLIKKMEENFLNYLYEGVTEFDENNFYDCINWDVIEHNYKLIIN